MQPDQDEIQWHYIKDDQQFGPIPQSELIQLFQNGILGPMAYVWNPQFDDWALARDIPDLVANVESPRTGLPPWVRYNAVGSLRPASVTVFGVLNIIFGSFGLLATSCVLADTVTHPLSVSPHALVAAFILVRQAIGFVMSFVMVTSGAGLLNLKFWARKAAIILAVFQIVWTIISSAITIVFLATGLMQVPGFEGQDMWVGLAIGAVIALAIVLAYPILVIVFLRKPPAVQACNR